MNVQDIFVGSVAIALGGSALLVAITNWGLPYRLRVAHRIERAYGRRTARLFYAGLGIVLLLLGTAIALGFGPNRG